MEETRIFENVFIFTEASSTALNVILSTWYDAGKDAECVRALTNDTQIYSSKIVVYRVCSMAVFLLILVS